MAVLVQKYTCSNSIIIYMLKFCLNYGFQKEVTRAQIIYSCRILMEFGFTQFELRGNRLIFEQRNDRGLKFSGINRSSGYFFFFNHWLKRKSQRKAMPKNVQTTAQLHSSHTLAKECSKFFKPGFNNMWTVNFQMLKLDLEKAEEPEIKLPTSLGS